MNRFSQKYLECTIIFSLFYLLDCKFVDLMIFLLYARQNLYARKIRGFAHPSAPDTDRASNLSRPGIPENMGDLKARGFILTL